MLLCTITSNTHTIGECENMVVAENRCTDMYKSMWITLDVSCNMFAYTACYEYNM